MSASASEVRSHVADCVRRIAEYPDPAVWISKLCKEHVDAQVEDVIGRAAAGESLPMLGVTVAVKDNIDVANVPTTAACPAFEYTARTSATVVQRLQAAGAIVLGKTNLDQFATGLVGTRSPYGACRNFYNGAYISGGSSSGSAIAVAAGLVDLGIGTDTAGSGRVPAAFNNLVGLKPTRGLVSTAGLVPACQSLDCISFFAKNISLVQRALHATQGFDAADIYSRKDTPPQQIPTKNGFRFGIPADSELEFFGNTEVKRLYQQAISRAVKLGGKPVTIDYTPFRETAVLLYEGPWVAERYAVVKELLQQKPESLLPVIRQVIGAATRYSAVDAFEAQYKLMALRRLADVELGKVDVLLLPTAGTIYTFSEMEADPVGRNRNLGYYTNFVNLLDLCALAIPAGFQSDGLPAGITLMAGAGADDALAALGERFVAV